MFRRCEGDGAARFGQRGDAGTRDSTCRWPPPTGATTRAERPGRGTGAAPNGSMGQEERPKEGCHPGLVRVARWRPPHSLPLWSGGLPKTSWLSRRRQSVGRTPRIDSESGRTRRTCGRHQPASRAVACLGRPDRCDMRFPRADLHDVKSHRHRAPFRYGPASAEHLQCLHARRLQHIRESRQSRNREACELGRFSSDASRPLLVAGQKSSKPEGHVLIFEIGERARRPESSQYWKTSPSSRLGFVPKLPHIARHRRRTHTRIGRIGPTLPKSTQNWPNSSQIC